MRSFEGIRSERRKWIDETGGDESKLMHYMNCRADPMPFFPAEGNIIDHIPPSELHIHLGLVNQAYDKMVGQFPSTAVWASNLHVVKAEWNQAFEGNECRKLLNSIDKLERIIESDPKPSLQTRSSANYENGSQFVAVFHAIKKLEDCCFG
jgi:hypothetical protein